MSESTKAKDFQLLALLDSLRKSGAMNLGELNWYNARRGKLGGLDVAVVANEGQVERDRSPVLSRTERKTIEKILATHRITQTCA